VGQMQQLGPMISFYVMSVPLVIYMLAGAYKDFSSLKSSELLPENWQRYLKNNIKIQLTGVVSVTALIVYATVTA